MEVLRAWSRTHRWRRFGLKITKGGLWVALLLVLPFSHLSAQSLREQQLKGVLLYNLIQFVDWPTNSFTNSASPIRVALVGNDSFGDLFQEIIRDEKVNQRPIVVERNRSPILSADHLVFIGSERSSRIPEVLERTKGRPILTVSDSPQFLHQGGMVRLYRNAEDKIRIQINLNAVRASNLTISAKLLRVAEIVEISAPGAD